MLTIQYLSFIFTFVPLYIPFILIFINSLFPTKVFNLMCGYQKRKTLYIKYYSIFKSELKNIHEKENELDKNIQKYSRNARHKDPAKNIKT